MEHRNSSPKGKYKKYIFFIITFFSILIAYEKIDIFFPIAAEERKTWDKRWVYLGLNMTHEENNKKAHEILERAQHAGFNGVIFSDFKTATWFHPEIDLSDWEENVKKLRQHAKDLGLEFRVLIAPFGYSNGILAHDVNLATGYPIKSVQLRAENGQLVPISSKIIKNASFEMHNDREATDWSHDNPGTGSFIDHDVVKDGSSSLRFEKTKAANRHGHARIKQVIQLKPYHHYRMRIWMKAEDLSGWFAFQLYAKGKRSLQQLSQTFHKHTAEWTEYVTTFNSVDHTSATLYAGIWGGTHGRFWLDQLEIEAVPTLNILRRDDLPLKLTSIDNTFTYKEHEDFEYISDPKLGQKEWTGNYSNTHQSPIIKLTPESRIKEQEIVHLSAYHAFMMPGNQVTASMTTPKVYEILAEQVRQLDRLLEPDGFHMGHDEIRTGGWEPEALKRFKTSGELFAWNIKRSFEIAKIEGNDKPVTVWSDMFDPNHNARKNYYMVNNTIEGAANGLDPDLSIITWLEQRKSVEFFSKQGHAQILAAYYDKDINENYKEWIRASQGLAGVSGVMYCTWSNNWEDLEAFAEVWWGKK